MGAAATAIIVVIPHPLADPRLPVGDAGATRHHSAAWFMTGDYRPGRLADAAIFAVATVRGAIGVQVTAAHAGRFDRQHNLARPWFGIGEVQQGQLPIP
jgi:hypothetical protein